MAFASSRGVLGLDGLKKENDISPMNQWNTNIYDDDDDYDDDQVIELGDATEFVAVEK